MTTEYKPFMNIAPGEFIKEELELKGWSQEDLASILGMSLNSVSKLIKGKKRITVATAKRLGKAFGQSPEYWLNLDTNYVLRAKAATQADEEVHTKATIYEHMPVREMVKKGWLRAWKSVEDLVRQVEKFWDTRDLDFSSLQACPLPNMRKSEAFPQFNTYYALTWYRMAQRYSRSQNVPVFRRTALAALAEDLHEYTLNLDGIGKFLTRLNRVGVKFFVLEHLSKTYLDGACFYDGKNPVIAYTARHDRIDNFWFTVAHEIGHILLHLKRKGQFFLDNIETVLTEKEKEADEFASRILKAREIQDHFEPYGKYISRNRVEAFSEQMGIHPGIVVGVLQHFGSLSRMNLNRFKREASDLIPRKYWA